MIDNNDIDIVVEKLRAHKKQIECVRQKLISERDVKLSTLKSRFYNLLNALPSTIRTHPNPKKNDVFILNPNQEYVISKFINDNCIKLESFDIFATKTPYSYGSTLMSINTQHTKGLTSGTSFNFDAPPKPVIMKEDACENTALDMQSKSIQKTVQKCNEEIDSLVAFQDEAIGEPIGKQDAETSKSVSKVNKSTYKSNCKPVLIDMGTNTSILKPILHAVDNMLSSQKSVHFVNQVENDEKLVCDVAQITTQKTIKKSKKKKKKSKSKALPDNNEEEDEKSQAYASPNKEKVEMSQVDLNESGKSSKQNSQAQKTSATKSPRFKGTPVNNKKTYHLRKRKQ